jgi:RimJ/RimL family protein N-acetyltransferase
MILDFGGVKNAWFTIALHHITGEVMELVTARLLLREFRPVDLEALAAYESHPAMRRFEKGLPDRESAQSYLENAIRKADETPRTHYRLAITVPPEATVIGRVSLTSQNPDIREWEIGWAVGLPYRGRGYAAEAARRVLAFAFEELGAHRVVAFCHADNAGSVKVMEKIGMQQEGRLRQTRWWDGRWADEFVYAILETDFAPINP